MATDQEPMQLLQLPDPCLLAVLQCCAGDLRSLFSTARAHSRLHQAAVLALTSITADIFQQHQADSLLLYLSRHGQHVNSTDLAAVPRTLMISELHGNCTVTLRQLPPNLRLHSLSLQGMLVQLQPGSGLQGVVQPGVPCKRLLLFDCRLLDGEEGLAAALALLPGLEYLALAIPQQEELWPSRLTLQTDVLSGLQRLTFLGLAGVNMQGPQQGGPDLQPLQALTRLVDLRLYLHERVIIGSSMLSGAQHLTRLVLEAAPERVGTAEFEPLVLAGKTRLQHLNVSCNIAGAAAGAVQLLCQLQHLQDLTHLRLQPAFCGRTWWVGDAPAAFLSALTASSKLQHLHIDHSRVPAAALQHIFPDGRQLQHLQSLAMGGFVPSTSGGVVTAFATRLVSCCPALQSLSLRGLQDSVQVLVPLQGLSGLHNLTLALVGKGFEAVSQLTGLRTLHLMVCDNAVYNTEGLLQLTQLQQLTWLKYNGPLDCTVHANQWYSGTLTSKEPGDEPVWRQILRLHLSHSNPQVAEQAATALEEQP